MVNNYWNKMSVQMDTICRTCLSEERNMKSIFDTDSSSGEAMQLFEMLMACTSLQVAQGDGLPAQICLSCINYMARSYTFKKLCEDSDATLRKIVEKATITDGEPLIQVQPSAEETSTANVDSNMRIQEADESEMDIGDLKSTAKDNSKGKQKLHAKKKLKTNTLHNANKTNRKPTIDNHKCKVCRAEFTSARQFAIHMKGHGNKNESVECGKKLDKTKSLARHGKSHVGKENHVGKKNHVCSYCGKGLLTLRSLQIHKRMHGEKPFFCNVCDTGFITKSHLREHLRIHTGEKPHPCHLCSEAFSRSEDLRYHIKKHTGKRDHICSHCGKGFYKSSILKSHLRIHTGEKPYACNICHKSFVRSNGVSQHLERNH